MLRLEKYPHRMNFAKGILETRKQTYRHLKKLLKAVPLEVPTVLELAPGRTIRVTLLDANHCVGAVMFLVEDDSNAVLYTGDIRSELWWVNSLCRQPMLLPYVSFAGKPPMKRLSCIYLDTTFATKDDPYKHFPPKADGVAELLSKLASYPKHTIFYFDSWTFGYEDVWLALSAHLGSQVHVDDYRWGLYRALVNGIEPKAAETHKLMGFQCGNHDQPGCLTTKQSRIHSCERGTGCEVFGKEFVRITPIISRHEGVEMAELGAGGGQGDLNQQHELEVGDDQVVAQLMALCVETMQSQPKALSGVLEELATITKNHIRSISLDGNALAADGTEKSSEGLDDLDALDDLPLERLIPALTKAVEKLKMKQASPKNARSVRSANVGSKTADGLPKQITFPYSRHSSYTELCYLIEAFKPTDIHPCTVDSVNWTAAQSMNFLFGHLYNTPPTFTHDQTMLRKRAPPRMTPRPDSRPVSAKGTSSMQTAKSKHTPTPKRTMPGPHNRIEAVTMVNSGGEGYDSDLEIVEPTPTPTSKRRRRCSELEDADHGRLARLRRQRCTVQQPSQTANDDPDATEDEDTGHGCSEASRLALRRAAYDAALEDGEASWSGLELVSVSGHQAREEEL